MRSFSAQQYRPVGSSAIYSAKAGHKSAQNGELPDRARQPSPNPLTNLIALPTRHTPRTPTKIATAACPVCPVYPASSSALNRGASNRRPPQPNSKTRPSPQKTTHRPSPTSSSSALRMGAAQPAGPVTPPTSPATPKAATRRPAPPRAPPPKT